MTASLALITLFLAVAAPIYGPTGTLLALLWIVGFASRFKDDHVTRAIECLRAEAKATSQSLAGRPQGIAPTERRG